MNKNSKQTPNVKEATHTPGPWVKSHNGNTHTVVYNSPALANFGMRIANVPDPSEGLGRAEANARLIAAAPELLDGFKELLEAIEDIRQMAEGRSRVNMADGTSLASFCRSVLLGKDAIIAKATGGAE